MGFTTELHPSSKTLLDLIFSSSEEGFMRKPVIGHFCHTAIRSRIEGTEPSLVPFLNHH